MLLLGGKPVTVKPKPSVRLRISSPVIDGAGMLEDTSLGAVDGVGLAINFVLDTTRKGSSDVPDEEGAD